MAEFCSLQNKTVLVTGASSGIGQSVAILCSQMGATLILTGRNEERLAETLKKLSPGNHRMIPADLQREEDILTLVQNLPKLDGVVHSAGIGCISLCRDVTRKEYEDVFSVNFMAPVLLQAELLRQKRINPSASLVFVASKAADIPSKGNSLYSASKAALISYAKCLALELSGRKIRVNCVLPTMVWTNFIYQAGMTASYHQEREAAYPLGRYGTPEDVADLVLFLLSDNSSWMTGSALDITGGAREL